MYSGLGILKRWSDDGLYGRNLAAPELRWSSPILRTMYKTNVSIESDITTRILPTHWAGYLINGDTEGFFDEELEHMFYYERMYGPCVGVSEESWFARRNDAMNIGADVSYFDFRIN